VTYAPIPGTLVIGLGYRAQHGKDQAAAILARRLGCDVQRFAISDAIAVVARVSHGMTSRDPKTLQDVGYAERQRRPGVWLETLYGAIADRRPRLALVTGIRFPDEAQLVKDMSGATIRVTRVNADGSPFVAPDRPADHPTEHGLDGYPFDYTIVNVSGELEAFARDVMVTFGAIAARVEDGLPVA
jgi:hypothetical protein